MADAKVVSSLMCASESLLLDDGSHAHDAIKYRQVFGPFQYQLLVRKSLVINTLISYIGHLVLIDQLLKECLLPQG